jgi:large repetitive protein
LNVSEKTQVTLTINGENRSNFSFNSSNGTVSAAVQLMTGNNVIRLSGSNADGMDTKEVTIVYRPTQTQQPPVVNFVNPSTSPTQVNQNTFELVASVSHVETQSGVKVTVNGVNTNFTFNSGQVKLTLNLVEGANVVEVKGTNTAGTDSKTSTLVYRKPNTVNPPVVSFIQPDQSPKNVDQSNFTVVARVNNVSTKSEITVRINGQSTSQFVFTASSHEVKFDLNLIEGNNTIEVSGTNSAGSDSKTVQLVYRPKVVSPPTVKITAPEVNPYNTQVATYTLEAKLTNISNVDPIVLKWNNVSNNSYQYNASTGILKLPMELYEGENNLTIQVSNADGTASDQMKIVYKKPVVVNAPTVVFTKPSEAGSEVNSPVYKMDAKVFNVESAQQIDFKMNGSMVSSANWSYNSTSKIWSYSANLEEGNNFFELVATNEGGSALAQTNIRYIKPVVPCEKPKVVFQQPTKNGVVFQEANQNVQFTLQGNNAELMSVKLNGAETQRFTATNGIYNLTVALQNGNNVVEVNARNNCGSVSAYLTMVYEPKTEPCKIPTIQMLVPSQNSLIVEETFIKLELGVAEVVNESKIQLTLNGTSISFIFDAGTKILRSDVNLVVGKNVIEVTATNDCGSKKMKIEVERLACNEPGYTLVNASIPNGQSSANRTFSLDLALSHITNESQIKVKLNNQQETFDFDDNHVLHFDKVLNLGSQTLTITLTNSCGTKTFIHKVTILKSDVQGPTVSFTTPNTNPITVVTQNYQVEFKCTNILNASNIAFKLNGSVLPVVFDYNSQKGQVNVNLKQGVNTVEVTAVNNAGSASATSTIVLALESKQNPPEISLDKTYGRLEIVKPGIQKISGSVSNITDPKNLEIKVNGKLVTRVNTSVVNGKLNFDFTLNMEITNPSQTVEIGASNSAGRDKKYLAFKLETQPVRTTPVPNTPQGGK